MILINKFAIEVEIGIKEQSFIIIITKTTICHHITVALKNLALMIITILLDKKNEKVHPTP